MLNILLTILLSLVGLVLGFYLLLLGRRALWATAAIICLTGTSALLAIIFLRENTLWSLVEERNWILLGVAAGAAVIGGVLGARVRPAAGAIVGFAAGAEISLWFYKISYHLVVVVGQMSEQTAFWVGIIILIIGGLIGLYFTRRYQDAALILISVAVGTRISGRGFGYERYEQLHGRHQSQPGPLRSRCAVRPIFTRK